MSQPEDKFLIISVPKTHRNAKSKHYVVATKNSDTEPALIIGGQAIQGDVRAISSTYGEAETIVGNLLS